jgi:hypothetical protein
VLVPSVIPSPSGGTEERPSFGCQPLVNCTVVLVGLVEADRASERGERRWKEKIANYQALFASSALKATTGYANARVLVITPTERRAEQLGRLIAEHAAPALAARFWLARTEVLQDIRLRKEDWRRAGGDPLEPLLPSDLVCQSEHSHDVETV